MVAVDGGRDGDLRKTTGDELQHGHLKQTHQNSFQQVCIHGQYRFVCYFCRNKAVFTRMCLKFTEKLLGILLAKPNL